MPQPGLVVGKGVTSLVAQPTPRVSPVGGLDILTLCRNPKSKTGNEEAGRVWIVEEGAPREWVVCSSNLLLDVTPVRTGPTAEDKRRLEKGLAVDLLREHLPNFFKEAGPMDIYADNIAFVDDISPRLGLQPVRAIGKENYASMLWTMRFHASLFCSDVKVHIVRFWQPIPDCIMVRWQTTFCPRLLNGVYGTRMTFDGTSEFLFNREGKIYRHRVDILNTDGFRHDLSVHFLFYQSIVAPMPTC